MATTSPNISNTAIQSNLLKIYRERKIHSKEVNKINKLINLVIYSNMKNKGNIDNIISIENLLFKIKLWGLYLNNLYLLLLNTTIDNNINNDITKLTKIGEFDYYFNKYISSIKNKSISSFITTKYNDIKQLYNDVKDNYKKLQGKEIQITLKENNNILYSLFLKIYNDLLIKGGITVVSVKISKIYNINEIKQLLEEKYFVPINIVLIKQSYRIYTDKPYCLLYNINAIHNSKIIQDILGKSEIIIPIEFDMNNFINLYDTFINTHLKDKTNIFIQDIAINTNIKTHNKYTLIKYIDDNSDIQLTFYKYYYVNPYYDENNKYMAGTLYYNRFDIYKYNDEYNNYKLYLIIANKFYNYVVDIIYNTFVNDSDLYRELLEFIYYNGKYMSQVSVSIQKNFETKKLSYCPKIKELNKYIIKNYDLYLKYTDEYVTNIDEKIIQLDKKTSTKEINDLKLIQHNIYMAQFYIIGYYYYNIVEQKINNLMIRYNIILNVKGVIVNCIDIFPIFIINYIYNILITDNKEHIDKLHKLIMTFTSKQGGSDKMNEKNIIKVISYFMLNPASNISTTSEKLNIQPIIDLKNISKVSENIHIDVLKKKKEILNTSLVTISDNITKIKKILPSIKLNKELNEQTIELKKKQKEYSNVLVKKTEINKSLHNVTYRQEQKNKYNNILNKYTTELENILKLLDDDKLKQNGDTYMEYSNVKSNIETCKYNVKYLYVTNTSITKNSTGKNKLIETEINELITNIKNGILSYDKHIKEYIKMSKNLNILLLTIETTGTPKISDILSIEDSILYNDITHNNQYYDLTGINDKYNELKNMYKKYVSSTIFRQLKEALSVDKFELFRHNIADLLQQDLNKLTVIGKQNINYDNSTINLIILNKKNEIQNISAGAYSDLYNKELEFKEIKNKYEQLVIIDVQKDIQQLILQYNKILIEYNAIKSTALSKYAITNKTINDIIQNIINNTKTLNDIYTQSLINGLINYDKYIQYYTDYYNKYNIQYNNYNKYNVAVNRIINKLKDFEMYASYIYTNQILDLYKKIYNVNLNDQFFDKILDVEIDIMIEYYAKNNISKAELLMICIDKLCNDIYKTENIYINTLSLYKQNIINIKTKTNVNETNKKQINDIFIKVINDTILLWNADILKKTITLNNIKTIISFKKIQIIIDYYNNNNIGDINNIDVLYALLITHFDYTNIVNRYSDIINILQTKNKKVSDRLIKDIIKNENIKVTNIQYITFLDMQYATIDNIENDLTTIEKIEELKKKVINYVSGTNPGILMNVKFDFIALVTNIIALQSSGILSGGGKSNYETIIDIIYDMYLLVDNIKSDEYLTTDLVQSQYKIYNDLMIVPTSAIPPEQIERYKKIQKACTKLYKTRKNRYKNATIELANINKKTNLELQINNITNDIANNNIKLSLYKQYYSEKQYNNELVKLKQQQLIQQNIITTNTKQLNSKKMDYTNNFIPNIIAPNLNNIQIQHDKLNEFNIILSKYITKYCNEIVKWNNLTGIIDIQNNIIININNILNNFPTIILNIINNINTDTNPQQDVTNDINDATKQLLYIYNYCLHINININITNIITNIHNIIIVLQNITNFICVDNTSLYHIIIQNYNTYINILSNINIKKLNKLLSSIKYSVTLIDTIHSNIKYIIGNTNKSEQLKQTSLLYVKTYFTTISKCNSYFNQLTQQADLYISLLNEIQTIINIKLIDVKQHFNNITVHQNNIDVEIKNIYTKYTTSNILNINDAIVYVNNITDVYITDKDNVISVVYSDIEKLKIDATNENITIKHKMDLLKHAYDNQPSRLNIDNNIIHINNQLTKDSYLVTTLTTELNAIPSPTSYTIIDNEINNIQTIITNIIDNPTIPVNTSLNTSINKINNNINKNIHRLTIISQPQITAITNIITSILSKIEKEPLIIDILLPAQSLLLNKIQKYIKTKSSIKYKINDLIEYYKQSKINNINSNTADLTKIDTNLSKISGISDNIKQDIKNKYNYILSQLTANATIKNIITDKLKLIPIIESKNINTLYLKYSDDNKVLTELTNIETDIKKYVKNEQNRKIQAAIPTFTTTEEKLFQIMAYIMLKQEAIIKNAINISSGDVTDYILTLITTNLKGQLYQNITSFISDKKNQKVIMKEYKGEMKNLNIDTPTKLNDKMYNIITSANNYIINTLKIDLNDIVNKLMQIGDKTFLPKSTYITTQETMYLNDVKRIYDLPIIQQNNATQQPIKNVLYYTEFNINNNTINIIKSILLKEQYNTIPLFDTNDIKYMYIIIINGPYKSSLQNYKNISTYADPNKSNNKIAKYIKNTLNITSIDDIKNNFNLILKIYNSIIDIQQQCTNDKKYNYTELYKKINKINKLGVTITNATLKKYYDDIIKIPLNKVYTLILQHMFINNTITETTTEQIFSDNLDSLINELNNTAKTEALNHKDKYIAVLTYNLLQTTNKLMYAKYGITLHATNSTNFILDNTLIKDNILEIQNIYNKIINDAITYAVYLYQNMYVFNDDVTTFLNKIQGVDNKYIILFSNSTNISGYKKIIELYDNINDFINLQNIYGTIYQQLTTEVNNLNYSTDNIFYLIRVAYDIVKNNTKMYDLNNFPHNNIILLYNKKTTANDNDITQYIANNQQKINIIICNSLSILKNFKEYVMKQITVVNWTDILTLFRQIYANKNNIDKITDNKLKSLAEEIIKYNDDKKFDYHIYLIVKNNEYKYNINEFKKINRLLTPIAFTEKIELKKMLSLLVNKPLLNDIDIIIDDNTHKNNKDILKSILYYGNLTDDTVQNNIINDKNIDTQKLFDSLKRLIPVYYEHNKKIIYRISNQQKYSYEIVILWFKYITDLYNNDKNTINKLTLNEQNIVKQILQINDNNNMYSEMQYINIYYNNNGIQINNILHIIQRNYLQKFNVSTDDVIETIKYGLSLFTIWETHKNNNNLSEVLKLYNGIHTKGGDIIKEVYNNTDNIYMMYNIIPLYTGLEYIYSNYINTLVSDDIINKIKLIQHSTNYINVSNSGVQQVLLIDTTKIYAKAHTLFLNIYDNILQQIINDINTKKNKEVKNAKNAANALQQQNQKIKNNYAAKQKELSNVTAEQQTKEQELQAIQNKIADILQKIAQKQQLIQNITGINTQIKNMYAKKVTYNAKIEEQKKLQKNLNDKISIQQKTNANVGASQQTKNNAKQAKNNAQEKITAFEQEIINTGYNKTTYNKLVENKQQKQSNHNTITNANNKSLQTERNKKIQLNANILQIQQQVAQIKANYNKLKINYNKVKNKEIKQQQENALKIKVDVNAQYLVQKTTDDIQTLFTNKQDATYILLQQNIDVLYTKNDELVTTTLPYVTLIGLIYDENDDLTHQQTYLYKYNTNVLFIYNENYDEFNDKGNYGNGGGNGMLRHYRSDGTTYNGNGVNSIDYKSHAYVLGIPTCYGKLDDNNITIINNSIKQIINYIQLYNINIVIWNINILGVLGYYTVAVQLESYYISLIMKHIFPTQCYYSKTQVDNHGISINNIYQQYNNKLKNNNDKSISILQQYITSRHNVFEGYDATLTDAQKQDYYNMINFIEYAQREYKTLLLNNNCNIPQPLNKIVNNATTYNNKLLNITKIFNCIVSIIYNDIKITLKLLQDNRINLTSIPIYVSISTLNAVQNKNNAKIKKDISKLPVYTDMINKIIDNNTIDTYKALILDEKGVNYRHCIKRYIDAANKVLALHKIIKPQEQEQGQNNNNNNVNSPKHKKAFIIFMIEKYKLTDKFNAVYPNNYVNQLDNNSINTLYNYAVDTFGYKLLNIYNNNVGTFNNFIITIDGKLKHILQTMDDNNEKDEDGEWRVNMVSVVVLLKSYTMKDINEIQQTINKMNLSTEEITN